MGRRAVVLRFRFHIHQPGSSTEIEILSHCLIGMIPRRVQYNYEMVLAILDG
jgi:hypothetical protein